VPEAMKVRDKKMQKPIQ